MPPSPDVNAQVVVDIVCHLFDPHLVRSRTGIKSLVSPSVALDFPFLPASPSPTPRDSDRHSISAQRLALFRIPALVVNYFPGFSWTLEHVRGVRNVVNELGRSVWVVEVEWTLSGGLYPLTQLPFVGPKLHLAHVSKRQIELVFEPPATSDEAGRDSHRSIEDEAKHSPDIDLVLTRVSYSGIKVSEILKAVPGYSLLAFLVPYLIELLLAPFYGLLLLLGLDHSSSSVSSRASSRRRNQKSVDRKGKGKDRSIVVSRHSRTKPFASLHERGASSSDSEDGVESVFDPNAKESRYHRVMRIGRNVLYDVRRTVESLASGTRETGEEFKDLIFVIRRMVMVAVEIVLGVMGAGLDVLGAGVGSAIEEGERIARETREEEEEMRQARAQTRFGRSSGPPGNGKSSLAKSPTLGKRVSFSVPEDGQDVRPFIVSSTGSSPSSARSPGPAAVFNTDSPFVEEGEEDDPELTSIRDRLNDLASRTTTTGRTQEAATPSHRDIFTSRPFRTGQEIDYLAAEDDDIALSRLSHQGHHLASSSDSFLHPFETTSSTERRANHRREDTPIPGHVYGALFDEKVETAEEEDVEAEKLDKPAGIQVRSSDAPSGYRHESLRTGSSPVAASRKAFAPDVVSAAIASPPLVTVPTFPSSAVNMARTSSHQSSSPAFGFSPPTSGQLYRKGSTSGSSSFSPTTPGTSPVFYKSGGAVSSPMVHESSGSGSNQGWPRFGQPEEVVGKEEEGDAGDEMEEGEKAPVRTKGKKRKGKKRKGKKRGVQSNA